MWGPFSLHNVKKRPRACIKNALEDELNLAEVSLSVPDGYCCAVVCGSATLREEGARTGGFIAYFSILTSDMCIVTFPLECPLNCKQGKNENCQSLNRSLCVRGSQVGEIKSPFPFLNMFIILREGYSARKEDDYWPHEYSLIEFF